MRYIERIIAAALIAMSSYALNAKDIMTLKDCMKYAIEHSTDMKLQGMDMADARIAQRDAVLKAFTPSLSAGTYAYSNFGRSVDPETNTYVSTTSFNNGYSVSGSLVIFNGFEAVNNVKIAKTAVKMGISEEQQLKDNICLAVMEAYYNVVFYRHMAQTMEEQVRTSKNAVAYVKRQEELGQKGYADVIEMEAELADREYDLISYSNMITDSMLTLKELMTWPMEEELNIDTEVDEQAYIRITPENEVEGIVEQAERSLPSIAIARGRMQNAAVELKTAKWQFSPYITLNAGWSTSYYTYPGQHGYVPTPFWNQFRNNGGEYIQLSLSFPIYDRLSRFSNLSRKKNAYTRASAEYDRKVRQVHAEVTRAVEDRDGAAAAFRQADKRAEVQNEAYRMNQKKFEQGLLSPLEYQRAADNWMKARSSRINSLLTYYIKRSVVDYYNGISYIEQ